MNQIQLASLLFAGAVASPAMATDVFRATLNNGFFTPFNSTNAAMVKYGDGGWLGSFDGGTRRFTCRKITLLLCASGNTGGGTTDIVFTFNEGDPSGLVFGNGHAFYTTTIQGVQIPDTSAGGPAFFPLQVRLPNIQTTGGFNNIGFSVGLENYQSNGSLGFGCSASTGQQAGFYTNNASYFNGSGWSLFAFSQNPTTGVANFVCTISDTCDADFDGDGTVDFFDYDAFVNAFEEGSNSADIDGDGAVDFFDYDAFVRLFELGC